MATRYPLIIDTSDGNKIKELPNGDNLNLVGNSIVNVVNVTATGALSVNSIEVGSNTFTVNGNSLNTVAFSGNYADLTGTPTIFNGNYDNLTNKPSIKTTVESLDNVSTTAPTNNQILQYNSSSAKYVPSSIAAVSASSIDALLDVNVSNIAPASGQILKWDGGAWIRGNASSGQNADTLDSYEGTYFLNYNNFTNKPNVLASVTADDTDTFTATSNTDNFKIFGGTGITTSILNDVVTITNSSPDQTVAFTNGTNILVTGTYPNFTISSNALAGISINSTNGTPNANGGLAYNAGVITYTPPDLSSYLTNTGLLSSHTDVDTTAPTSGQVLKWSGTAWAPAADSGGGGGGGGSGDIEAVAAGTGLTGGGTVGSVTLNVDVGTTANKIVQIDSTGKLPAIDGSQLTNISGGGGSSLTVQEEGSSLSTAATTLNFVGAGVTATGAGSTKTVTIPAGSTDLNSLNAATVDTDNDSIAFVDANDANTSKRVSIQNFLEAIKGTGLGRTNGQLTVTGLTVQEEGSDTGDDATVLNFVGTGVTATGTGSTKTITITGSGGSGFTAGNDLDQANANLRDIGYLSYRSSSATPTKILTVTVGTQGAEDYYNTQGSSNKYRIDGDSSPFLSLAPGIYRFDQADNTNSGHPLRFYEDPAKTTQYTTGVTNSGTPGTSGAYTQITIDKDTKTPLYYQCTAHAYMGHGVEVVGGTDNTGGSSTIIVQEEGSSLSSAATTLNFVGAGITAAGTGTTKTITVPAGTDINSLASAVIDTTADSIAFSDANDSNNTKKESVTDFLIAIAGTNLVHNNGQLDTSGVLTDVVNDASPQLGGDLDVNGRQLKYTFNITASGTSHYVFNDTNNLFFASSGENDPTLYLQRGNSYVFNNTTGAHPLAFKTPDGTAYTTGVTTYNTNGKTFNIPMNAPPLLYYYCTNHSGMQGAIYIDGDDLNSVAEAAISTANDKIAFIDDDDQVTKKEAITDFLEAIKGTGLGRSGGQLTATNTFVGLTDTPSGFSASPNHFVKVNGSGNALEFDDITANSIDSTHIDFGTGTNQVNTDDLTEGSTNLYYTDTRAQAISINALSEDAAPSLGANLTAGSHNISMASGNLVMGSGNITSVTNQDIDIDPHGTGKVTVGSNLNVTGTVTIAGSTLEIPTSFTIGTSSDTVIIAGSLQVTGNTTTINSNTLDVNDLNITVAKGAADAAAANGAGITVDGAAATFTYASSGGSSGGGRWVANKQIFAKNASGAEVDLSAAAANAATTGKAIAMAMVFG